MYINLFKTDPDLSLLIRGHDFHAPPTIFVTTCHDWHVMTCHGWSEPIITTMQADITNLFQEMTERWEFTRVDVSILVAWILWTLPRLIVCSRLACRTQTPGASGILEQWFVVCVCPKFLQRCRNFGQTHTTNHCSRIPDAPGVCVRHANLEQTMRRGKVHKIHATSIETSTRVNSHLSVISWNKLVMSACIVVIIGSDQPWHVMTCQSWHVVTNMVGGAWKSCPRIRRDKSGSVLNKLMYIKWWGHHLFDERTDLNHISAVLASKWKS